MQSAFDPDRDRLCTSPALHLQQSLLSLYAPSVPSDAAVLANDAMARDNNRDRIRGARSSNSAASARLANRLSNLSVGLRLTERNRLQVGPYPPLESRGANVERQR